MKYATFVLTYDDRIHRVHLNRWPIVDLCDELVPHQSRRASHLFSHRTPSSSTTHIESVPVRLQGTQALLGCSLIHTITV